MDKNVVENVLIRIGRKHIDDVVEILCSDKFATDNNFDYLIYVSASGYVFYCNGENKYMKTISTSETCSELLHSEAIKEINEKLNEFNIKRCVIESE